MDPEGTVPLNTEYATLFSIDSFTGVMIFTPALIGHFEVYAIARTEAGVINHRVVIIDSRFFMHDLFVYPICNQYGYCTTDTNLLFPLKQYAVDDQCFMTESSSVDSSELDNKDTSGDLMQMLSCANICTGAQDFVEITSMVAQISLDFIQMPYTLQLDSFVATTELMNFSHIRLKSYDPYSDTTIPLIQ